MPSWHLAPSLVALRNELNEKWPKRDRASDGAIGNAEHSSRVSDHNPDGSGRVHAIDIDKDGIDVNLLLQSTVGDHRVNYVIWNRQIWSRVRNFRPIPYNGVNAHKSHVHVSILYTDEAETDRSRWLPKEEEDVMATKAELKALLIEVLTEEKLVENPPTAKQLLEDPKAKPTKMSITSVLKNIETDDDNRYNALKDRITALEEKA